MVLWALRLQMTKLDLPGIQDDQMRPSYAHSHSPRMSVRPSSRSLCLYTSPLLFWLRLEVLELLTRLWYVNRPIFSICYPGPCAEISIANNERVLSTPRTTGDIRSDRYTPIIITFETPLSHILHSTTTTFHTPYLGRVPLDTARHTAHPDT